MEMEWWTDLEKTVDMESEKKSLDCVQFAFERLVEQRRNKEASSEGCVDDEDEDLLLCKLISQLESLKGDSSLKQQQPPAATEPNELSTSDGESRTKTKTNNKGDKSKSDEIKKELKKVRKQNTMTHWLLSIMIILTITWQLSEVSLILMVKNRVSHPLRSFRSMLAGIMQLRGPNTSAVKLRDDEEQLMQLQNETPSLPHLALPEIPPFELPVELPDLSGREDRQFLEPQARG